MFAFRFVPIDPILADLLQIPYLTIKSQGQGQIRCSHSGPRVQSIYLLFVSWQLNRFGVRTGTKHKVTPGIPRTLMKFDPNDDLTDVRRSYSNTYTLKYGSRIHTHTYAYRYEWMFVDRWMDGWMDGCMHECMYVCKDRICSSTCFMSQQQLKLLGHRNTAVAPFTNMV